ncbi:hypothetical protein KO507_05565 [Gilvimarinus agarilyticus]|uniref:hypothetical protein n=1 Tax=Gilvimarinus sp. 2_MG-2023 TaxID=3062666 RepID=UPI001C08994E|nr:hypothetical protein [Gilvimarinus sp. 2_MG-2023]MBU2885229.1 hypothetical protein [Gilvimarinus agarilyticus]MDO6570126.1 hypothetical protein [Gilvimarinus sp. 2_MG-2023]
MAYWFAASYLGYFPAQVTLPNKSIKAFDGGMSLADFLGKAACSVDHPHYVTQPCARRVATFFSDDDYFCCFDPAASVSVDALVQSGVWQYLAELTGL